MSNTHTHTIATMEIPAAMHAAILRRLQEADYVHAIGDDGLLDLSGIGLQACPGTNAWWQRSSDWHPATTQACLEQMEDMREDWSQLAKLLGFATFTDPEQIFSAVRALTAWPPQAILDGEELRRAVGVVGVVGQFDGHDVVMRNSVLDVIDRRIPKAVDGQLPSPKTAEQRRWFMAGASAVATGRAFVNAGDSERQFIADSDDDTAALQVATQFTSENEPRKRAELQVAIIAALQRARASQERGLYHVADTLPIAVNARRLGHCLEVIRLNLGSIESSARHLVPGNNDDRLRLANMQHEVTHAQQVLKSVEEIVCELLTGTKVPPAFDYFAPEYYTHDGAGLVHFSRVPPAEWPEWATEALQRMGGGTSLYDDLLAVLQAKDHTTARANIGGMRGRIVSLQSQLEDSGRRLVDAQRLAWALVDAAGGSVELGQSVLATTDWRGKKLQQLQVPTGGVRFTSTQDTPR